MFSYKPLFKLLLEKNMNKTKLKEKVGFSTVTLAKLSRNEYVSMKTLDDICKYLNCNIEDIMEYIDS